MNRNARVTSQETVLIFQNHAVLIDLKFLITENVSAFIFVSRLFCSLLLVCADCFNIFWRKHTHYKGKHRSFNS